MDIGEFFQREYVTADEIETKRGDECVATILGNERVQTLTYAYTEKKTMFIDVQFAVSKEIRPLKLGSKGYPNTACKQLKALYGTNIEDWVGKTVRLYRVPYGEGKYTVGVQAHSVIGEVVGNALS